MDLVKSPWGYRFLGTVDRFTYADEKLRPTWRRKRGYRLPDEHRRQLCVHLAAHAVVSSMGGAAVHMLAVAPAGVRSWTISERKARKIGKMWGICSTSDFYCRHLNWDGDRQIYAAHRSDWERDLEHMHTRLAGSEAEEEEEENERPIGSPPAIGVGPLADFIDDHRIVVRAQVCGYLAGHIADGITAGLTATEALRLYDRRKDQDVGGASDIVIAEGLAGLLPPGEHEHAIHATEELLRRPEVWDGVRRLADALRDYGLLENDDCEADIGELLPPGVGNWPPPPAKSIADPAKHPRRWPGIDQANQE